MKTENSEPRLAVAFSLEEMKQARRNLFEAAITPPFDYMDPMPRDEVGVAAHVERCRQWHNNVLKAFYEAYTGCMGDLSKSGNYPDLFPVQWIIGEPQFGDLAEHRDTIMARFDERCAKQAKDTPVGRPDPLSQASFLVFDIRRRALGLVDWMKGAIRRFETARLPQIELGPEINGRRSVAVMHGGVLVPDCGDSLIESRAKFLIDLASGEWCGCSNQSYAHDLMAEIPPLRSKIHGGKKDAVKATRNPGSHAYKLDAAMAERVTWPSKQNA